MHPEYLYNNDTQEISRRIIEWATTNEPTLRTHCQEVSHHRGISSLCLQRDCVKQVNDTAEVLSIMKKELEKLSQSLASGNGVFRTREGGADFPGVCLVTVRIEEERQRLLEHIAMLTKTRRAISESVAKTNRVLHFLSLAKYAVDEKLCSQYDEWIQETEAAYARLTRSDAVLREAQSIYMTLVERHLPAFMERLRTAADFNHAGAGLDRTAIRALCGELSVLLDRSKNVSF